MTGRHRTSRRTALGRVDIVDETFVSASPLRLAPIVKDPRNHVNWWPHLHLLLLRERGAKGAEWAVTGHLDGTLEVWLEPFWDGTILHHYVRGVPGVAAPADVARRHATRWKAAVTQLKDVLESRHMAERGMPLPVT